MSRGRSRKESQRGGAYLSGLWSCVTSVNGEAEVSRSEKVEVLGSPRFLTVLSVSYLNRISFQSQSVSISFSKMDFFFFFLHCTAGGILVPQPGIKPRSPQWNCGVILPGPPGNSPKDGILGNSGIYEVGRISAFLRQSIFLDVCRVSLFFLSRKGLASLTFLLPFGIRKLPNTGGVGWRVGVNWGTWLLWQSFHHLSCNSFEKCLLHVIVQI